MSGLGALFILFTDKNKRVGDFAASTIVVVEEKKTRPVVFENEPKLTDQIKNYVTPAFCFPAYPEALRPEVFPLHI